MGNRSASSSVDLQWTYHPNQGIAIQELDTPIYAVSIIESRVGIEKRNVPSIGCGCTKIACSRIPNVFRD
jgi:hypothetical protein